MKTNVTEHDFCEAFRTTRPDNFSYQGLRMLYEYLTETETETDEIELDVILFCCEFNEEHWVDVAGYYDNIDLSECEDDEEKLEAVKQYIHENTTLVDVTDDGNVIYGVF